MQETKNSLADPSERVGVVNTRDAKLHYFQTRYDRAHGARKVNGPVAL
jgi:hypothetical protein